MTLLPDCKEAKAATSVTPASIREAERRNNKALPLGLQPEYTPEATVSQANLAASIQGSHGTGALGQGRQKLNSDAEVEG